LEEAKELIDYGECFICGRRVPRQELRMPTICPDCYTLAQYIVQHLGTGPEAMQKAYEALTLYFRVTSQKKEELIAEQSSSEQDKEEELSEEERKYVEEVVRRIVDEMKKKRGEANAAG
jgi:hypothetical protein